MVIAESLTGLSASQRTMAALIEREFTAAGYSEKITTAAIVNAYAESRLNPTVIGDSGRSVGLFQLNINGAGAGLSVSQRQDPVTNIRTLIARERSALAKVAATSGISDATSAFCRYVERPSNPTLKCAERTALALRLLPGRVFLSSTPGAVVGPAPRAWWMAWAAAGLGLVAAYSASVARRHGAGSSRV